MEVLQTMILQLVVLTLMETSNIKFKKKPAKRVEGRAPRVCLIKIDKVLKVIYKLLKLQIIHNFNQKHKKEEYQVFQEFQIIQIQDYIQVRLK